MQRSTLKTKSGGDSTIENKQPKVTELKAFRGRADARTVDENELPEMERLVSASMHRLAGLPTDAINGDIGALLRQVLDTCRFDRCGLLALTGDGKCARVVHAACREGIAALPEIFSFSDTFHWTGVNLLAGDIVCFTTPAELPPRAEADCRHFEAMGVQSFLAIPFYVGGHVAYFIVAHHVRTRRIWRKETISHLRLIGEVFVNALGRSPENGEVDIRLRFERLFSELSVRFINLTAGELDREIVAALGQVRQMFRLDSFGLITISSDRREAIITHSTCEGLGPFPDRVDMDRQFPWSKEVLMRGETIHFPSLDDLPAEAAIDRQSWRGLGVGAGTCVPIHVAGSVEYLIIAANAGNARNMDTEIFPRLRLLGEIFANSLVRCHVETAQRKAWEEIQRLRERLQADTDVCHEEIVCSGNHEEIIGQSTVLAKTLVLAEQVAPTDSTVLISGETGTGKELIARMIHRLSLRRNKPLVKVNCASLPATLVESELFGREKGAYTGALTRQAGRFELADGGTIFLDEIAEMSLDLQAKLLRVLQEGQFERLGSTRTIQVDVRVIAATNRNLAEEVRKGNFREDLYYRLNVFQIVIPPLRERLEDIPLLIWAFVDEFGDKMGKKINKIAKQDMAALQRYFWPGNVRELRNVVEHAVIVSSGDRLQVQLPENNGKDASGVRTLEEYEIMHIKEALRQSGWRIKGEGGAARLLGLNPSTLYSRMQKLGISNRNDKDEMSH
ncbi:MAG TPA: sigma 54-interacting transcriptional regulator [Geobacteraceae bacterium]|nr:sigma 54-interacting transcriptional regulator [Geobacteraceae bacterium]